jgi:hypothetical protein
MAPRLALVYSKANLSLKQIIREAKMEAGDIERYLAELGTELKNRGLKKPVRVLLIGGAYAPICQCTPFYQRHRHLLARRRWTATSECSAALDCPGYQTKTRP